MNTELLAQVAWTNKTNFSFGANIAGTVTLRVWYLYITDTVMYYVTRPGKMDQVGTNYT